MQRIQGQLEDDEDYYDEQQNVYDNEWCDLDYGDDSYENDLSGGYGG